MSFKIFPPPIYRPTRVGPFEAWQWNRLMIDFFQTGYTTAAAWPVAKLVKYVPFSVYDVILVDTLWVYNGATVAGNMDLGIYDKNGTRLVNSGSTARTGNANVAQFVTISSTALVPGFYFLAVTLDTNTDTVRHGSTAVTGCILQGVLDETTGSFGLPATATYGLATQIGVPFCGVLQTGHY